ncbi:MAG: hypothetical protein ACJA2S_004601 [Cyclobacteriaceae bacterium]|jgi:hypothetical protein
MRILLTFIIVLFSVSATFAQLSFLPNDISKAKKLLPENIKTIKQYKNDLLMNVREYDSLKNLTFSYYKQYVKKKWNGEYLTIIKGLLYNENGRIEKSFNLHSNAGLTIYYYEYDSMSNNTRLSLRKNDYERYDSLINTNAYHYISAITSIQQLISFPKISEIEKLATKNLLLERKYDSLGNMLKEFSFNENGDTTGYELYEYDENNNKIYFYNEWSKNNHWEYFYEYEKPDSFFEESIEPDKTNLLQSVRVNYDWKEKRKRISDISLFKYDDNDRLIEKTKYNRGEFQDKYLYEYNESGQVIKRTAYVYDIEKVASIKTYSYNEQGNVLKEIDTDFRSGEKTENEYHYEYEYYK